MVVGQAAKRLVSPTLVGRAGELELLVLALSAPPAVAVIEGEAGIGKTRIVTELQNRPELATHRSLIGSCSPIREPFPLGPVIEAVRGLGADLAARRLSPVAGALRPLLPEIADVLPPLAEPLDDRDAERHRVFRGLVEVLDSIGPTVLVLEDLHWADELTVDFVSYLLGSSPPLLSLVLTFRAEEAGPRARALTAKLPASTSSARVQLPPLDEPQTGELAAGAMGIERVSAEFAAYLCERASGLPFAVEELLALLQARGKLVQRGGRWTRRVLDELDVPAGIRDPVLERVSRLSGMARMVVEAAAVLQVPVPVPVLAATCQAGNAQVSRGAEEALASGLFGEFGAAVGYRHVLAAQAVYDNLPRLRLQALHSCAASALSGFDPSSLGRIAHHLRHAGRLDEWVGTAEMAADRAVELGHDEEATRLLEDLLRNAPLAPGEQGRIAVKLGRAAIQTFRGQDVAILLAGVLEQDLPATVRGELRFRLALLLDDIGGDPVWQRQLCTEAVADLDGRPDLRAWAMVDLGIPTVPGVSLSEHLTWLNRSLEVLPKVSDPSLEVIVLGKAAMVQVSIGVARWRPLAERILAITNGSPQRRREVNAHYSVGIEAAYAGHHHTAHRLLAAATDGAAGCENKRLELMIQSASAVLSYCRGRWDGLAKRVDVLIDELADYTPAQLDVEVVAGSLALARSNFDGAQQRLAAVIERAEQLGAFSVLAFASAALTRATMARGDIAAAVASVERMLAALEPHGIWLPFTRTLPWATDALVAAGQHSEASSLVSRCAQRLGDLDAPLATAALRFSRGVLKAGAQRWLPAVHHFLAAAEAYEPLWCPYEAAQANERAAACLFAAGAAGGEDPLRAAMSAYQPMGASWDADRAANLARRHDVALPGRHRGGRRGYGDQLSPRERQVAELAATGRTNKEIASELFLSPKTVDKHLRAGLRKLGLRSRTALAHHLYTSTRGAGEQ